MSHEWGNYPDNIEPKMYWGARAIIEDNKGIDEFLEAILNDEFRYNCEWNLA